MHSRELNRQFQQLWNLIEKTQSASDDNFELRAHWARYICVRVAGFLENAVLEIFGDFARKAASKPVADFATSVLSDVQNPKAKKFVEIAGSFNIAWVGPIESYLDANGRGEAINSIMANRHDIAHGRYSGITMARVIDYLGKSVEVLEFIENQCSGR